MKALKPNQINLTAPEPEVCILMYEISDTEERCNIGLIDGQLHKTKEARCSIYSLHSVHHYYTEMEAKLVVRG